ncbi:PAQR family membrane homeostasis protein TrhA [Devosia psychrophila]|uniref:DNA-binding protein n=1 Tax=Devosia psychrophila TaxID=728005 RepID=A0A0F5PTA1_9HYPH|nr:hemolysin III family protein [Devosia psychrophila]KKC31932.1 DNA-binding protein [Devosia psychrophila]SFC73155.1 hemolysin III [Devosia psychrophila]
MNEIKTSYSWWSREQRPFTVAEMVVDGIVHVLGLIVAVAAGSVLLAYAILETAPEAVPALAVYVGSLVAVLGVSLAYNMWPVSPIKMWLARFDQAAIFLFIAGTYTPFLAVLGGTTSGIVMTTFVWGASLIGVALKLIVPERFGRLAIALYLAIGWSGILVFQSLAQSLPSSTMMLLLAGGVTYSLGIIFHLWEKLKFQNALWHVFVVGGASLHLWAVIDCMVIHRL